MPKRILDFIVVGAQKSGTTTLFEHLAEHPELTLPLAKEAPFFNNETKYGGDWDRYLDVHLGSADPGRKWGTVTPQYMSGGSGPGLAPDVRTTPRRLKERLPDVKLIAILRDPVARARSHHAMALIEGWDTRPFGQAIREQLEPEELARSRRELHENTSYVLFGEYGRILSGYYEFFSAEQLLVLFTKDLSDDPGAVMRQVFDFIDVDPDFIPEGIGKHYHQSGAGPRLRWLDFYRWQVAVSSNSVLKSAWHGLPDSTRRRIDRRYQQINYRTRLWNARGWRGRRDAQDAERDPEVDRMLVEHFRSDAALLSELVGLTPPWVSSGAWRTAEPVRV